jgi:zinc/manganese transport system ATP-binding protein
LDEPTSNLDPGAQENLADVIYSINQNMGITVLLVSHDVNLIAKYAHQVMYITNGHYVLGTVDQVMQSSVLSQLYDAPVEVLTIGSKIVVLTSAANNLGTSLCLHGCCEPEVTARVPL